MNAHYPLSSALLVIFASIPLPAQTAETLTLEAVQDTTLYSQGERSNGQGDHLFVGQTNGGDLRRALLAFDFSALPEDAQIENAVLSLVMNRSNAGNSQIGVHRVERDWGEGASDAASNEGRGASAAEGDATWTMRFFPDEAWASAGGDFLETASASTSVGGEGTYQWSGSALIDDVQAWVDDPAANTGWILIGDESRRSTKRFHSRHSADSGSRPQLTVTYIVRETAPDWAGYPVENDGTSVNTDTFIGWIDIAQAPWVYSYSLGKFIYLPESAVSDSGAWVFVRR